MSCSITEKCTGCTACIKVCPVDAILGKKKEQHIIDVLFCIECEACGRICPVTCVLDDNGHPVAKLKKSRWSRPTISIEKCYACENCIEACPADALAMAAEDLPLTENTAVLVKPEKCVSCGWCFTNCLFDAIFLEGC